MRTLCFTHKNPDIVEMKIKVVSFGGRESLKQWKQKGRITLTGRSAGIQPDWLPPTRSRPRRGIRVGVVGRWRCWSCCGVGGGHGDGSLDCGCWCAVGEEEGESCSGGVVRGSGCRWRRLLWRCSLDPAIKEEADWDLVVGEAALVLPANGRRLSALLLPQMERGEREGCGCWIGRREGSV